MGWGPILHGFVSECGKEAVSYNPRECTRKPISYTPSRVEVAESRPRPSPPEAPWIWSARGSRVRSAGEYPSPLSAVPSDSAHRRPGRATEEICKILEVTRTNFGVLLYRARNRLRECLEAKGMKA